MSLRSISIGLVTLAVLSLGSLALADQHIKRLAPVAKEGLKLDPSVARISGNTFGTCFKLRDCTGATDKSVQLKICRAGSSPKSLGCSWRGGPKNFCVAEFNPNPKRCGGKDALTPATLDRTAPALQVR